MNMQSVVYNTAVFSSFAQHYVI